MNLDKKNIFKPFQIEEYSDRSIHLTESKARRIFLFAFFRIFPILMCIAIFSLIFLEELPIKFQIGLFLIIPLMLFIFAGKYLVEIELSDINANMTSCSLFGKISNSISLADVNRITIETFYFSNDSGYFYRLELKANKKQIPLLTIPYLYMNVENKKEINKVLEKVTSLKVEKR